MKTALFLGTQPEMLDVRPNVLAGTNPQSIADEAKIIIKNTCLGRIPSETELLVTK